MFLARHCCRCSGLLFVLAFFALHTFDAPESLNAGEVVDRFVRIQNSKEPFLRLDPKGSAVWDVRAHKKGFFSLLNAGEGVRPFSIDKSAFTDQIVLTEFGIGIGTNTPFAPLHVNGSAFSLTGSSVPGVIVEVPGAVWAMDFLGGDGNDLEISVSAVNALTFNGAELAIGGTGEPNADLEVRNSVGTTFSRLDAGDATFTVSSSRKLKTNIRAVKTNVLPRMIRVPVVTFDWKERARHDEEGARTNKIGLIAEDFHTILQRGSNTEINGQEVQMVLWRAAQELHEKNEQLRIEQRKLTARLDRLRAANSALEESISRRDSEFELRLREIEQRLINCAK